MRLIDADKLEDILVNHGFCYCNESDYSDGVASGFLLARDDVKEAPTIDAEPVKHGHWHIEEYPDGYYHSQCSLCNSWFTEDAFLYPYKYCPFCGASMEAKDEDYR